MGEIVMLIELGVGGRRAGVPVLEEDVTLPQATKKATAETTANGKTLAPHQRAMLALESMARNSGEGRMPRRNAGEWPWN